MALRVSVVSLGEEKWAWGRAIVVCVWFRLLSAIVYLSGGAFRSVKNVVICLDPQGLGPLGWFSRLSSMSRVLVTVSHRLARVACTVLVRIRVLPWSWQSVKEWPVVV